MKVMKMLHMDAAELRDVIGAYLKRNGLAIAGEIEVARQPDGDVGVMVPVRDLPGDGHGLDADVGDLEIWSSTSAVLRAHGIATVCDLVKKQEGEVLQLRGMGRKGLKCIKEALMKRGLHLSPST